MPTGRIVQVGKTSRFVPGLNKLPLSGAAGHPADQDSAPFTRGLVHYGKRTTVGGPGPGNSTRAGVWCGRGPSCLAWTGRPWLPTFRAPRSAYRFVRYRLNGSAASQLNTNLTLPDPGPLASCTAGAHPAIPLPSQASSGFGISPRRNGFPGCTHGRCGARWMASPVATQTTGEAAPAIQSLLPHLGCYPVAIRRTALPSG